MRLVLLRVFPFGFFVSYSVMLFCFVVGCSFWFFIRGLSYLLVSAVFWEVVVGVLRIVVCMSLVVSEAGPLLLFGRVSEARAF